MAIVVGVRFKRAGRIYYFDPQNEQFEIGDGVIVETARGTEFGKITVSNKEVLDSNVVQPLKPILRRATQKDEEGFALDEQKRDEALKIASQKAEKHNLEMKLVDVEYTFDGSKIIFYFSAEGRVDFRDLVKDLASHFRIRIELRQIGIRDECKMLGGMAPCGRECCCSSFLSDFGRVSIKMAKNQGLSLNPTKISGLCGRLMCCLGYENEVYTQLNKKLPKQGSEVETPEGKGVVISLNPLRERVNVRIAVKDGFEIKEFSVEEIRIQGKVVEPVLDEDDELVDIEE